MPFSECVGTQGNEGVLPVFFPGFEPFSSADKNITLDLQWTVLCAGVYDTRPCVSLKFESKATESLEIQEDIDKGLVEVPQKAGKKASERTILLASRRQRTCCRGRNAGGSDPLNAV